MKYGDLKMNDLLILKTLVSGKLLCGVQIRDIIWECFKKQISYTTLYGKLDLYKEKNILDLSSTIDGCKYYEITELGIELIDNWESSFKKLGE
jgi:DNA-binding PadR family transcriptional regulator